MFFLAPHHLWLLLALPVLPLLYLWLLRRRGKLAVRYSSLGIVRAAIYRARSGGSMCPPPCCFWLAPGLLLATARPMARVPLPWARTTIVLAMDVSLSMRVSDVKPTRMVAAQEAAKLFLQDLPRKIEVALVTFAGSTQVAQAATLDRPALVAAIDGFQMQRGTAIGSAIVTSLAELFPGPRHQTLEEMTFGSKPRGKSLDDKDKPPPQPLMHRWRRARTIPRRSSCSPMGARTTGVDTLEAAKMAADRGVCIHVIGLGSVVDSSSNARRHGHLPATGRTHPARGSPA